MSPSENPIQGRESSPKEYPSSTSGPRFRWRPLTAALVVTLIAYFAVLASHAAYSVGGCDATGYASLARSLLKGNVALSISDVDTFSVPDNYASIFAPLAYTAARKNGETTREMLPFYPIGFPLHEAAGVLLAGWQVGPYLVSPLLAALSCWLVFCIALRFGLSRSLSAAAALILCVNPSFIFLALQPMSDVTATFWGLVMVWAALRARENERWMLLAGAAFGIAFLVRPTNIMLLAPLVFCAPLRVRSLIMFGLGGLPLAIVFFAYNTIVFGNPLQTGYSSIGLPRHITLKGMATRFNSYVYWIAVSMSPIVLLLWAGVTFIRSITWWRRAALLAWFTAFLLFYAGYEVYDEWWYTRFLFPAYPALIIGGLLTLQVCSHWLFERRAALRWATVAVALLVMLVMPVRFAYKYNVLGMGQHERLHTDSMAMAEGLLPERAVLVSMEMSGVVHFYSKRPVIRYDEVNPATWQVLKTNVLKSGYQFYGLVMDGELDAAQQRTPGNWTEVGRVRHVALWRIDPLSHPPPVIKFDSGFYGLETGGGGNRWRWMSNEGVISLQNTARNMRLRLEGEWPVDGFKLPGTTKITLNGVLLETIVTSERALTREYQVTAAQQGTGQWSELRILIDQTVIPQVVNPASNDSRHLSLSLTKLIWEDITPRE